MNDVSELLAKCPQRLVEPFSREWIADFSSFMEFTQTNPSTLQILESIKQQKEEAHMPLIGDLKSLLHEGARFLREIQKSVQGKGDVELLVDSLLKMKVDPKMLEDPFFELESLYNEYYVAFVSLLRTLAQDEANTFISKYCLLSCMKLQDVVHLNIDLTFSPYLQKCKQDIETLGGQRTGSQWGNWDVLLKWAAWSKNGISPRNDAFERNLSNLFKGPKIAKIVQSSGVFFLKRLANTQIVNIASLVVVGAKIHLKQKIEGWGAKTIENLSKDLKSSFPNMQGFSFRNLKYIPYFVKEYPDFAIGQQLVAEIPFAFYPNKKVFKEVIL